MSKSTGSGLPFLLHPSLAFRNLLVYSCSLGLACGLLSNEPISVSLHTMLLDVRAKQKMKSARQLTKGSCASLLATYTLLPSEMFGMSKKTSIVFM
jgi:hypothetical protein